MKQLISFCLSFAMASVSLFISSSTLGQQANNKLPNKSTEIQMPVSPPSIEETYLNTVSTTGADGTKYKLVVIGDMLPKFYINGQLLSRNEMEKYNEMIDKLTPVLWQRQKQVAEEQKKEISKITSAILKELIDKHYFKDEASVESFLLSSKELVINKHKQSNEMFIYFWNKFGESSDAFYYYDNSLK
jgi:hypothetical protein